MISILAGIVILAINPARQLAEARNTQRRADVNKILNALYQYTIDNDGEVPATITTTATDICASDSVNCGSNADLSVLTHDEKYLISLPRDPGSGCTTGSTCYTVRKSVNGRITVEARLAELDATIGVTR